MCVNYLENNYLDYTIVHRYSDAYFVFVMNVLNIFNTLISSRSQTFSFTFL